MAFADANIIVKNFQKVFWQSAQIRVSYYLDIGNFFLPKNVLRSKNQNFERKIIRAWTNFLTFELKSNLFFCSLFSYYYNIYYCPVISHTRIHCLLLSCTLISSPVLLSPLTYVPSNFLMWSIILVILACIMIYTLELPVHKFTNLLSNELSCSIF